MNISHLAHLFDSPPDAPEITEWLISIIDQSTDSSESSTASSRHLEYTQKVYPDATFQTYRSLGLDIVYSPSSLGCVDSTTSGHVGGIGLERVDVYNSKLDTGDSGASGASGASAAPGSTSRRRIRKVVPTHDAPHLPIELYLTKRVELPNQKANRDPRRGDLMSPAQGKPADPVIPNDRTPVQGNKAVDVPNIPEASESTDAPVLRISSHTTGKDFVAHLGEPTRRGGGEGWVEPWLEWASVEVWSLGGGGGVDGLSGVESVQAASSETIAKNIKVTIGLMVELRPSTGPGSNTQHASTGTGDRAGQLSTDGKVHMPFGGVWDVAKDWEWSCIKVFKAQKGTGASSEVT